MEYNEPWGGNTNDPYVDGNPSLGIEGSIIPAAAIEYTQREIVNLILKSQLTPTNGDSTQLAKSVQIDRVNWAIDQGTANNLVITLDPAPDTLVEGLKVFVLVKVTNTGTTTMTTQRPDRSGGDAGADQSSVRCHRRQRHRDPDL